MREDAEIVGRGNADACVTMIDAERGVRGVNVFGVQEPKRVVAPTPWQGWITVLPAIKIPFLLIFNLCRVPFSGSLCRVIFSESPTFTKAVQQILREEDYFELQDQLIDAPDAGDIIPGSKGLRKIRVASGGKGKRGGSRVIY